IMVRRLSGFVEGDAADPENASVVLTVEAGSLAVVDDDSEKDRTEIEKEMNEHVLQVAEHPAIEFKSRIVAAKPAGERAFDLVVKGDLALHGTTRELRIPVRLEVRDDG